MKPGAVAPFEMPAYAPPDFDRPDLRGAPPARVEPAPADGVLPPGYHATSNHPEYLHLGGGAWILVPESRMDAALLLRGREAAAVESRHVRRGDPVVVGRGENGEEGILVHAAGFGPVGGLPPDKFSFGTRGSREDPYSRSYADLCRLLRHEREGGYVLWVVGPAVVFDRESRRALEGLIEEGFAQALLGGNALAVHDLEAALYGTGLGRHIHTRELRPLGHYHHLDVINRVRAAGSVDRALEELPVRDGILRACRRQGVPVVLAGSIRDDGPLPGVITDAAIAQDAMRAHARRATTVLALATQLHAIAVGNMVPNYRVQPDGSVRPVFFYMVDMSEFGTAKLVNRGSSQARAILTNVQDFLINLRHHLAGEEES